MTADQTDRALPDLLRTAGAQVVLASAAILVLTELVSADVRDFWDQHPITTSIVTGALILFGAYFLLDRWTDRRESARTAHLRYETERTIQVHCQGAQEILERFGTQYGKVKRETKRLENEVVRLCESGDDLLQSHATTLLTQDFEGMMNGLSGLQRRLRHLRSHFGENAQTVRSDARDAAELARSTATIEVIDRRSVNRTAGPALPRRS